jgi:hypothetical protein
MTPAIDLDVGLVHALGELELGEHGRVRHLLRGRCR